MFEKVCNKCKNVNTPVLTPLKTKHVKIGQQVNLIKYFGFSLEMSGLVKECCTILYKTCDGKVAF